MRMAALVTHRTLLWDLSSVTAAPPCTCTDAPMRMRMHRCTCTDAHIQMHIYRCTSLLWDLSQFKRADLEADEPYYACAKSMAMSRPPPMSPDDVATEMRDRATRTDERQLSFSYLADLEPVIDLYRRGFILAIETFSALSPKGSQINYQGLGWADEHEPSLVAAWRYASYVHVPCAMCMCTCICALPRRRVEVRKLCACACVMCMCICAPSRRCVQVR